ncbi:hypothetical protein M2171_004933 [Bradyrhizobium japonicum USDA 38]|uniref:hypothetical protein n=1 Tax=Bradyrhizobium japonicum TaxID=375 RepID=UPI00041042EF|nr:hypothetical protein [Bradyrhizobium japonicum]MCS3895800.1 hypothetical protein [Bradyrhizobium japonicum USDA 38]MCS3948315.1 hypothetical protein [Bradyrhizobium japonicum]
MNAPAPIKILTACAEKYALCCVSGEMEIQWSVDMLQNFAEQRGLVAELGQNKVQDVVAAAFIWARSLEPADDAEDAEACDSGYAASLIMRWEIADPRDRWRWTGELPPAQLVPTIEKTPYRTAQSTIDAFHFVLSLGDPEHLAAWLLNHPDDAPALFKSVEAA